MAAAGSGAARSATLLTADQGVVDLSTPLSDADLLHTLQIESGKSVSLKTSYAVKRVSVGNPEILDVAVLGGHELQLVARTIGATNLLIWDSNGRTQAVIDVHVGTAYSHIERSLRKVLGNESISVEGVGNAVALKGSVSSDVALGQTLKLAESMIGEVKGAPKVINLLEVGGNHQVMLKVVIAEMSRTLSREFGVNTAALISTGGGNTVGVGNFIGGLASAAGSDDLGLAKGMTDVFIGMAGFGGLQALEIFLDLLDEQGLSKILAEPTLVARSGEIANFLVGGEVPIPIAQGGAFGSITVEYKDFGVGLGFTPTVLGPDRIHLQVNPEVSRPDFTFGTEVGGTIVPGFVSRRASTSVELADGQSFMIAGLLNESVRELAAKYPVLGDLPILGSLFRSTMFQKEETELVIIVTPTLVKPTGPGPHPLPTDHFVEPSALEFYLWGALEGKGSPETGHLETQGLIGETGHRVSTSYDGGTE
jgi:pilus assembly protein CpaC